MNSSYTELNDHRFRLKLFDIVLNKPNGREGQSQCSEEVMNKMLQIRPITEMSLVLYVDAQQ
jgi:hypothetical protein